MFKALLVALIGLFFSTSATAQTYSKCVNGSDSWYGSKSDVSGQISYCTSIGRTWQGQTGAGFSCSGRNFSCNGSYTCDQIPEDQRPESCPSSPPVLCPDNSIAPNDNPELCPWYDCSDGSTTQDPDSCPVTCPDGSTAPNGSLDWCPINCDILNGPTDPSCDTEEPPNGYCGPNQSPIFDDCVYGPDDPRNPPEEPDPDAHCQQFPESASCNHELPELPDDPFCQKYPDALSCQTPELPDLGTDTDTGTTPIGPPPEGGTGTGTDTGTPIAPPPAPPPTSSGSSSHSTDARLDNLRYDIARLHSGLNYQTNVIAAGLTGVGKQLQANGAKTDRSNTLLDGINKNLDTISGGLKGAPLTEGNFDVQGGINTALGITGNESVADLTDAPVRLENYTNEFQPFLSGNQCPENIPVSFSLFGSQSTYQFYYKPVCDFMGIAGTVLNWAVWLFVPFIVFGRRRAS